MINSNQYFWAKTDADEKPGISVQTHMNNVGAVALYLTKIKLKYFESLGLNQSSIASLSALHDIGKISQGFQSKCEAWLKESGFYEESRRFAWGNFEQDHSRVSQFTLQNIFQKLGIPRSSAILWAALAGAHHGRTHDPGERGIQANNKIPNDIWETIREEVSNKIIGEIGNLPKNYIHDDDSFIWIIAGLISVADWIGSDENYFSNKNEQSYPESLKVAEQAVQQIGFLKNQIIDQLNFSKIFKNSDGISFQANPLQALAEHTITQPGLYIIEAPMGLGKTEAALIAAYQLMKTGQADGIYFALPTQTTSNRIYLRVKDFIQQTVENYSDIELIHSNSWLQDNVKQPEIVIKENEPDDINASSGRNWFGSSKRALLASFGVGTIDQALLAIVASKHFFVRRYALSGKVIIIDEVHSYDMYTGTLIDLLCKELIKLGSTVIILSATLTEKRKMEILESNLPEKDATMEKNEYKPTITYKVNDFCKVAESDSVPDKEVIIKFVEQKAAIVEVLKLAELGASVLWICDTIESAQNAYCLAKSLNRHQIELGLLHSRFTYSQREEKEKYWMDKLGKDGSKRTPSILFSTQVVEQSVDLDADLIVSELAPTDMLLQRIGRLWRHERKNRPLNRPEFWILKENGTVEDFKKASKKKIKEMLGSKASVYAPYILLRTFEVFQDKKSISIPGEIKSLLEVTYEDQNDLSKGMDAWLQDIEGKKITLRQTALGNSNIWGLPALNDEEGIQTRVSDYETVSFILIHERDGNKYKFFNDDFHQIKSKEYKIEIARSIQKNLIKLPAYVFSGYETNTAISKYIKDSWHMGIVDMNGMIRSSDINLDYRLKYTDEFGLQILKGGKKNESC